MIDDNTAAILDPILADGTKQMVIAINKQYPGPTLEVPVNAHVTVKVCNYIINFTTCTQLKYY